jgi:hypothetical protein
MFLPVTQPDDKKLVTRQALSYYFLGFHFKMTSSSMTNRDRFFLWWQEK